MGYRHIRIISPLEGAAEAPSQRGAEFTKGQQKPKSGFWTNAFTHFWYVPLFAVAHVAAQGQSYFSYRPLLPISQSTPPGMINLENFWPHVGIAIFLLAVLGIYLLFAHKLLTIFHNEGVPST